MQSNRIESLPFLLRRLDVADKRVQVADEGAHDELEARVLALLQARDGGIGQGRFVKVHGREPGARGAQAEPACSHKR